MEKNIFTITQSLLTVVSLLLITACSSDGYTALDDVVPYKETSTVNDTIVNDTLTAYMTFECQPPVFDDDTTQTTRATTSTWANNSVLYLRLNTSGTTYVSARAVYNSSTGKWTITPSQTVSTSSSSRKAEVYYFDGAGTEYTSSVNLSSSTGIYSATNATFTHATSSEYTLSANLKPYTWRLRFYQGSLVTNSLTMPMASDRNEIEYPSSFNRNTGTISFSKVEVRLSGLSSYSSSPYIYGRFTTTNSPYISIKHNGQTYRRTLNSSNLTVGESGKLTIPSYSSYSGWNIVASDVPFVINSVEVANVDYDGNIINNYGSTIYSYQTRYLKPILYITVYTQGTYTVYVKLFTPYGMSTGTSSPTGYSFSNVSTLYTNTTTWRLSGWGGNTAGHWGAGQYRWEFWYNSEKIGEKTFTIY